MIQTQDSEWYPTEIEKEKTRTEQRLDFDEPEDLDEAEHRRDLLVMEIQSIQTQLGSKNRTDGSGRRLKYREFADWRNRANHSHTIKSAELRFINRWIKQRRQANFEGRARQLKEAGALTHVRRMHKLLSQLLSEGVEFTPTELKQIKEAEGFVRFAKEEIDAEKENVPGAKQSTDRPPERSGDEEG